MCDEDGVVGRAGLYERGCRGEEVVGEVKARDERSGRIVVVGIVETGRSADQIELAVAEAEFGTALDDDGRGAEHLSSDSAFDGGVEEAVVGPLVEIAGDLELALLDDNETGEAAEGGTAQVHRHGGCEVRIEGAITKVSQARGKAIVLKGTAARLHEGAKGLAIIAQGCIEGGVDWRS